MSEGCRARVPDHTDYQDCGAPVLREERCQRHIYEEVTHLMLVNEVAMQEVKTRIDRINLLLGTRS